MITEEGLFLTLKISLIKYHKSSCGQRQICHSAVIFQSFICLNMIFIEPYDVCCLILLKVQLWHIQTNGQSLNWKVTKVLNKIRFLFVDIVIFRTMDVIFN